MKKLIAAIILATTVTMTTTACAGGPHGGHHGGHGGGHHGWIAPAIITAGVIGYALAPRHEPQVVYVQPAPVYPAYRPAEPVYQEVFEYDPGCGCYYARRKIVGYR